MNAKLDPAADTVSADAAHVPLFLAVQAGDCVAVARHLSTHPELLEVEAAWTDAEALAGGFDLAHDLTPLIMAAGQGHLETVDLLLKFGATPDGRCGCDNAETALWAAARGGHSAVVARLAAAGADTSARNRAGNGPEDLLRWRDQPPAPSPALPLAPFEPGAPLATGIAAVDLWLPLRVGAVVRVHGAAETGLMVLLAELAHALAAQGLPSLWTSWAAKPWHRGAMAHVARRYGLDAQVQSVSGEAGDETVLGRASEALSETHMCHVIFESPEHTAQIEAALPVLGAQAALTLVVQPWAAVTTGAAALPEGLLADGSADASANLWDGVLATDVRLAAQGLFPALHFEHTRSAWSAEDPAAEAARSALRVLAQESATLSQSTSPTGARAQRVLAVLTQAFHSAAPDTGWPGRWQAPARTHERVQQALSGALDALELSELIYKS
jgi:hypothetical protein